MKAIEMLFKRNKQADHVCPWQHVHMIDNFVRKWIHDPQKLFSPYVKKGMRVIDIGCGGGFISLGLAGLVGDGGSVVSADLQPEMLAIVNERAIKEKKSRIIHTHQCGKNNVGANGPFDFAVAFFMVHETPDKGAFMSEVFDMLASKGVFYIAEPSFHVKRVMFENMVDKAKSVGFRVAARPRVNLALAVLLEKP